MKKSLFDEEEETTSFQDDDDFITYEGNILQYGRNTKTFATHTEKTADEQSDDELTEEQMEKELGNMGELLADFTGIDENVLSLAYAKAEQMLLNEQKLQKIVENTTQAITNAVDNRIEPEIARNITLDALRMLIDESKI